MSFKEEFNLSPKTSFLVGAVAAVMVVFSIGFWLLLINLINDRASVSADGSVNRPAEALGVPSAALPQPSGPPPAQEAGPVPEITADDHVRGDSDAALTLIEYSDYECPFCGRFHPSMQRLMTEYEGKVRWVYRHFPLSFHQNSSLAANAAECAGEQDEFWGFTDGLFENQGQLGSALYARLASDLGLDKSEFSKCLEERRYDRKVQSDMTGGGAAGVNGTPGTIIIDADGNTQMVPGAVPYEQLKGMVDSML